MMQARSRERLNEAVLFVLLLVCCTYAFPRWADWNQNSRFDLTVAIVDHGTLSIDCCVANTGDFARFEGRTYSDKAPGLSFLAVPVYGLFRAIAAVGPVQSALVRLADSDALAATLRQGGTGLLLSKLHFMLGMTFASLLVVAVPSAVLGVVLYRFLGAFVPDATHRAAVTLTYGLGTGAFPYAGAFYAHQLVAALLFTAFVLLFGLQPGRASRGRLFLVGVLLGYAVISEYPAVLIAGVLCLYGFHRLGGARRLSWMVLGGLGPVVLAGAYNYAIYHSPLELGYRYSVLWHAQHSAGFFSLTHPTLAALWGITGSGFRGLFALSPVLLLAVPGHLYLWHQRQYRGEAIVSALAVLSFLVFNSSSRMWWGGFAVGPRYLVPMLPFLAWPLVLFLQRHDTRRGRALFGGLALLSFGKVCGLSWAGQQFPEERWHAPWAEYAWPRLVRGDLARNAGMVLGLHGWWSLLPLSAVVLLLATVWWTLNQRARGTFPPR